MKKFSKQLAILLALALMLGSFAAFSASAIGASDPETLRQAGYLAGRDWLYTDCAGGGAITNTAKFSAGVFQVPHQWTAFNSSAGDYNIPPSTAYTSALPAGPVGAKYLAMRLRTTGTGMINRTAQNGFRFKIGDYNAPWNDMNLATPYAWENKGGPVSLISSPQWITVYIDLGAGIQRLDWFEFDYWEQPPTGYVEIGAIWFSNVLDWGAGGGTAPVIDQTSLPNGTVGVPYSQQLTCTVGDTPITWGFALSSGLPDGLTLNPATGLISGTPTTAGPANFTITATNDAGADAKLFTFEILPAGGTGGDKIMTLRVYDEFAMEGDVVKAMWPDTQLCPLIRNTRTIVPLRFITEYFGYTVDWEGATESVVVTGNGKVVKLAIGRDWIDVDGTIVALEAAPEIVDFATMVPLRAIADAFGLQTDYDAVTGTIVVSEGAFVLSNKVIEANTAMGPAPFTRLMGKVIVNFGTMDSLFQTNFKAAGVGAVSDGSTYVSFWDFVDALGLTANTSGGITLSKGGMTAAVVEGVNATRVNGALFVKVSILNELGDCGFYLDATCNSVIAYAGSEPAQGVKDVLSLISKKALGPQA